MSPSILPTHPKTSVSNSSLQKYQQAKELFPTAYALSLEATDSLTNGCPEFAASQFRRAATLVPSSNEFATICITLSADALHRARNFPEAAATYLEAYNFATNSLLPPEISYNLLFMVADSFERANQPQKALSYFLSVANLSKSFVQQPPSQSSLSALISLSFESHYRIATLYERDADFECATAHYRVAYSSPDNSTIQSQAKLGIARCAYQSFNYEQALLQTPSLFDSPEIFGETSYLNILSLSALEQNSTNMTNAIHLADSFLDIISTNSFKIPFSPEIRFWRASIFFNGHDYLSAIPLFDSISTNHPSHSLADRARLFSGISFFCLSDYSSAIKTFASLVKDFPSSPLIPRARLMQARALLPLTRFEDAVLVLDDLIEHYPDSPLFVTASILRGEALRASSGTKNHFREAAISYATALSHGSASPEAQRFCQKRLEECMRRAK